MSVTGGIKFFEPNSADSKAGGTATASSGDPSANFILDRNKYTVWRSVGSDDLTTETIEISLPGRPLETVFSRLFLIGHNFKEFKVQLLAGEWDDIGDVIGINGVELGVLEETDYALNTAYYEMPALNLTSAFLITVTKTQTPNQEKFLNSFVVTTELGTFAGYPVVRDVTKDKKLRKSVLLNGRSNITKSLEVFRCNIDFKNYPPGLDADLNLTYSLFDRDENFLVWLCGGRDGEPYFKYPLRGFRIEDLHEVQTVNIFKDKYRKNTYTNMVDLKLNLEETG